MCVWVEHFELGKQCPRPRWHVAEGIRLVLQKLIVRCAAIRNRPLLRLAMHSTAQPNLASNAIDLTNRALAIRVDCRCSSSTRRGTVLHRSVAVHVAQVARKVEISSAACRIAQARVVSSGSTHANRGRNGCRYGSTRGSNGRLATLQSLCESSELHSRWKAPLSSSVLLVLPCGNLRGFNVLQTEREDHLVLRHLLNAVIRVLTLNKIRGRAAIFRVFRQRMYIEVAFVCSWHSCL